MTTLEIVFATALILKMGAELVLEAINRSHVMKFSQEAPEGLGDVMDAETYAKSNEYTLAKSRFGSIVLVFDAAVLALIVLSGVLPVLFDWWSGRFGDSNMSSALFLIAVTTLMGIPGLPFDYWSQFKIEERFGFNRSTLKLWITDKIKGGVIGFLIGFPLLWLLISLVGWLGSAWWIYAFVIMMAFQLLMMVLYPMLIMPLFNKLSPLEEGPLRDRLMALSDRAGFKAQTIQVIDGSKRSGHSNAYFTGFGKFRRIVLYDTLIEQLSEEELEAVLAHEIGHYKKGHIPKMIALSALMMLAAFWIIDVLLHSSAFFEGFGFSPLEVGSIGNLGIAMLLFSFLGGLVTFWISPLFHGMSRKHEYEADAFARDAVGDWKPLSGALRRLSEKNLSNLNPHPLYSGFHYSHPTLLERERAMKNAQFRMKREGDISSRVGVISPVVRWVLVIFVVLGALSIFLWVRSDQGSSEGNAYGFSGDIYRFGQADHEIVFGKTVDLEVVENLGDYLEQIGYFSPAYGGVIQILSSDNGFDVYLTYSRQYWDRADFLDEVNSIREDLEANVLMATTRIILVDEDEEGIHSMNLNPKGDD